MSVVTFLIGAIIAFGPSLAYIPQYRLIQETKNPDGFSLWVSAILLCSAILRIFYRFGTVFETPLLLQAVLMILTQLILLELCVHLKQKASIYLDVDAQANPRVMSANGRPNHGDLQLTLSTFFRDFWAWKSFSMYMLFLSGLVLGLGVLQLVFGGVTFYSSLLGYMALGLEACLGLPQVLKNYRQKNTEGLSAILIATWVFGDIGKVIYFSIQGSPTPFIACGVLQICFDLVIVAQTRLYR